MKINLLRYHGAFISKYKSKSGADKRCVVIPIDVNGIWVSDDNHKAVTELVAIQRKNDGDDSHYIQCKVSSQQITEGHRPPILGHLSEMVINNTNDHDEEEQYISRD